MTRAHLFRLIYTGVLYLILPILVLRLVWRSFKNPDYRGNIRQRFGFIRAINKPSIWVHAVSVGETIAATPLIKILAEQHPEHIIWVTNTTPTGAAMVHSTFVDQVQQSFIAFDVPSFLRRFIKRSNTKLCIIMETELWPNLLHICKRYCIPLVLTNARMSEKSKNNYLKIASITKAMLQCLTKVAAQTDADAKRLIELGLPGDRAVVTGTLKFDVPPPPNLEQQRSSLRQEWQVDDRPIWMVASTHEGEESIIIDAFKQVLIQAPGTLLLLAPRHPERAKAIQQLCQQQGFSTVLRSSKQAPATQTQILIGDTLGELNDFFPACDVCFMGGSLVEVGGHNLIEPALAALPILTGSILYNFTQVSKLLLDANAAIITDDANAIAKAVIALLQDPQRCKQMGRAGQAVIEANSGALDKQVALINQALATTE